MTRLEKLQALKSLVYCSGDQTTWTTCLWSEARRHRPFLEAGMNGDYTASHTLYFFDFRFGEYSQVFGKHPRWLKYFHLWQMIRREKRRMAA